MHDSYLRGIPWQYFMEFISPDADRFSLLKKILSLAELEHRILDIAGNRHFLIAPGLLPGRETLPLGNRTLLVAHYDRAQGSPGANDNSAGVFLLAETAMKLKKSGADNWIVIFTDKEELKTGESLLAQGSYSLALALKSQEAGKLRIFCFDACGAGDTLIISTTAEYLLKGEAGGEKLQKSVMELRQSALNTARDLGMAKALLAPTPFSDDAGFFRAGLAAQTITMLPSGECIQLVAELRKNPGLADSLISARKNSAFIPETWRSLNSPGDSYLRLTPKHFRTVVRFAEALCSG